MRNSGGWRKRVWREIMKFFGRGEKKVGGKKKQWVYQLYVTAHNCQKLPLFR